MKFRQIIPYIIFSAATVFPLGVAKPYNNKDKNQKEFHELYSEHALQETTYDLDKEKIDEKVRIVMENYINNAIGGTQRIITNKNKTGYYSAVRKELPGAPVSQHCLYGQYTQLNRALQQFGDSLQVIPQSSNAHMSTTSFKSAMTKLYNNNEYSNSIHRGRLYNSKKEYNKSLDKFVTQKTYGKQNVSDSLRNVYVSQFEKNNYCASNLNPGTIIIVNSGHAVMYLGIGKIKNNKFIPDENGEPVCCAYNREHPAIYLSCWSTSSSFAADIQNIITQKYMAQLEKQH